MRGSPAGGFRLLRLFIDNYSGRRVKIVDVKHATEPCDKLANQPDSKNVMAQLKEWFIDYN